MFDILAVFAYPAKKVFDAALSITKDVVKEKIDERNKTALDAKKAKIKDRSPRDIASLVLGENEISRGTVTISSAETYESLRDHVEIIKNWLADIQVVDDKEKTLSKAFVDLDVYLTPTRFHLHPIDRLRTTPLEQAIQDSRHCIILGPPGAGKTTSVKKLCSHFFSNDSPSSSDASIESRFTFPLLIRFRDLPATQNDRHQVLAYLAKIFPLHFDFEGALATASPEAEEVKYNAFRQFIDALTPLIILDGFDEYPSISGRDRLADEIRQLALSFTKAKIVLTCRTGEFFEKFDNTTMYEIAPLGPDQIRSFSLKWISNEQRAERFLNKLAASPYSGTALKPLLMGYLCAIYERMNDIPDQPRTVYERIVILLLEDWDAARGVERTTKYSGFSPPKKRDFLCNMAYDLSITTGKSVFEGRELLRTYERIYRDFGLDLSEQRGVIVR